MSNVESEREDRDKQGMPGEMREATETFDLQMAWLQMPRADKEHHSRSMLSLHRDIAGHRQIEETYGYNWFCEDCGMGFDWETGGLKGKVDDH